SVIMARALWLKHETEDLYGVLIQVNYGSMFTNDSTVTGGAYTVDPVGLTVTMGDVSFSVPLAVKTVSSETPYVEAGYSVTLEAVEWWDYHEGHDAPRFNTTTGYVVNSPFEE